MNYSTGPQWNPKNLLVAWGDRTTDKETKGRRLGRPRWEIDPARVESLRKDGQSIRQIARTLHVSPASVHKTLNLMAS